MNEQIEDTYRLSPVQEEMLRHALSAPDSRGPSQQLDITLRGDFNAAVPRQAWVQAVHRHAALHTSFSWQGQERPLQTVHRQVELPWEQHDWRGLSAAEQNERWEAVLHAERRRGFELSRTSLFRLTCVRLADDAYHLLVSHPCIVLDERSLSMLFSEVLAFCEAAGKGRSPQLEPGPFYGNYIAWLERQDLSAAEVFWRETLQAFSEPTSLGLDRDLLRCPDDDSGDRDPQCGEQHLRLSTAETKALNSLARRSPFRQRERRPNPRTLPDVAGGDRG